MLVYKDKRFVTNSGYPETDWVGDADFVVHDGSEIAEKIQRLYPNFELITDGDAIVDVTETEPKPSIPAVTDSDRLSAVEDAVAELIEMMIGGENDG